MFSISTFIKRLADLNLKLYIYMRLGWFIADGRICYSFEFRKRGSKLKGSRETV